MKKVLTICVLTVLVLSIIIIEQTPLHAEELDIDNGYYEYKLIESHFGSTRTDFVYSDSMFFQDPNILHTDMAKMSVALAMAAYRETDIDGVLDRMGYTEYENHSSYLRENELTIDYNDTVAYTIAYKVTNGKKIYIIPIKGTSENAEWFSNFNLGETVVHEGFRIAASEVFAEILGYIQNDLSSGFNKNDIAVLVTGHSRGAAVSNLVAGWLTEIIGFDYPSHIFGYTFACPAVSKNADTTFTNIYNYNNPGDFVPLLPLERWGYKRYGQSIDLISENDMSNIEQQYKRITGNDYSGEADSSNYLTAIYAFCPAQDDFYDPVQQFAFNVLAWNRSGGKQVSFMDAIGGIKGLAVPAYLLLDLSTSSPEDWAAFIFETELSFYGELYDFVNSNFDEVSEMSLEEFEAFLNSHRSQITNLEKCIEETIETKADFLGSLAKILNVKNAVMYMGEKTADLFGMLFAGGGIVNKIACAHDQVLYITWINSIYFGYHGWYQNTRNSEVIVNEYITNLGTECFAYSNLQVVILGSNLLFIPDRSFYCCASLENIVIPSSITKIGNSAFYNCSSLKNIEIPNSVTYIGSQAFDSCSSFTTSITIPETVANIGSGAFSRCTGVTDVTVPCSGIIYMDYSNWGTGDKGIFEGCSSIARVTITGSGELVCLTDRGTF